jgi:MFS family permease
MMGAAEAGFFPGVILYLTYWFPKAYRARIVAMFMVAIPLSSFFGSPISTGLLTLDGAAGLRGWQWLLIAEAIPAVLLGIAALVLLPSQPAEGKFLTPQQRDWLEHQLAMERQAASARQAGHGSIWSVLTKQICPALCSHLCGEFGYEQHTVFVDAADPQEFWARQYGNGTA